MPLLLDTGVIYALADADDSWHERVRDYLAARPDVLIVPVTVLPEVDYLLARRLGALAQRRFAASLAAGELAVEGLETADLRRASELVQRYEAIGLVDATVVAIAERLKLAEIATTDQRHFGSIRPRHRPAFDLVP